MNRRRLISALVFFAFILSILTPFSNAVTSAAGVEEQQVTFLFGNEGGPWKTIDGIDKTLPKTQLKGTAEAKSRCWVGHYSDGNWSINNTLIPDTEALRSDFTIFDKKASGLKIQLEFALPKDAKEHIESGREIVVAISGGEGWGGVGSLDIDKMLPIGAQWANFDFSVNGGKLTVTTNLRYNFKRQGSEDTGMKAVTMEHASKEISGDNGIAQRGDGVPIPEFGYGILLGAVYNGTVGLGSHEICYYDGDGFMKSSPYSPASIGVTDEWWLGDLRMRGNNAVLDSRLNDKNVHAYGVKEYKGETLSIGNGTFYGQGAVAAWFYFPFAANFYLADTDNLSASLKNPISSAPPGKEIPLEFCVKSTFPEVTNPEYILTIDGAVKDTGKLEIPAVGETNYLYSFPMSAENAKVIFTVNPENTEIFETNMEDNTVEWTIIAAKPVTVTGEITLDYNVLTQDATFNLGATTASFKLPDKPGARWEDAYATVSFTITNDTPGLYHNFKVDGSSGDTATISVKLRVSTLDTVTFNPRIQTTIIRDRTNFLDDPLNKSYGAKDAQNGINPPRVGEVTANGTATRPYSYLDSGTREVLNQEGKLVSEYYEERVSGKPVEAGFSDVTNTNKITVKVYNGKTPITPASSLKNDIEDNTAASASKHLWWESDKIPLTVLRPMGDKKASFIERTPPPVTGQYKRDFTNQNEAEINWTVADGLSGIPLDMNNAYMPDRDKSKSRDYNVSDAKKAVFASDKSYNSIQYPIRSGYFFNPSGTYAFSITTSIYSDTPNETEEHAQLVDAIVASFRYESNMVYINPSKQAVTIGGASVNKSGTSYGAAISYATVAYSPLFKITDDRETAPIIVEELRHNYTEAGTDPRFKRVLEGYVESGTLDSKTNYKYIEYVDGAARVYKITETTTVTIKVNPENKKVYTHPQLKNGDYSIRAYFAGISLISVDALSSGSYLAGQMLNGVSGLDRVNIKVVGSIYDDVN